MHWLPGNAFGWLMYVLRAALQVLYVVGVSLVALGVVKLLRGRFDI